MKKGKLLGVCTLLALLVSGCSCSKVDKDTYASAVSTYKSTDAIHFSRVEVKTNEGETTYTRKKIDAKYIFDANKKVTNMEYFITYYEGSVGGVSNPVKILKYYYSAERVTLYTYSKVGESQSEKTKVTDVSYDSIFNVDSCDDNDCKLMIHSNLAPVFELNEVNSFVIEDNEGVGEASFKGICPGFESCVNSSQEIDYEVTINKNGNLESISYDIVNGTTTYEVDYRFFTYGSNNVKVEFPADLESYIEK